MKFFVLFASIDDFAGFIYLLCVTCVIGKLGNLSNKKCTGISIRMEDTPKLLVKILTKLAVSVI